MRRPSDVHPNRISILAPSVVALDALAFFKIKSQDSWAARPTILYATTAGDDSRVRTFFFFSVHRSIKGRRHDCAMIMINLFRESGFFEIMRHPEAGNKMITQEEPKRADGCSKRSQRLSKNKKKTKKKNRKEENLPGSIRGPFAMPTWVLWFVLGTRVHLTSTPVA